MFDYIKYLEKLIEINVNPNTVRNSQCQLFQNIEFEETIKINKKRGRPFNKKSTDVAECSPVLKQGRYNLRARENIDTKEIIENGNKTELTPSRIFDFQKIDKKTELVGNVIQRHSTIERDAYQVRNNFKNSTVKQNNGYDKENANKMETMNENIKEESVHKISIERKVVGLQVENIHEITAKEHERSEDFNSTTINDMLDLVNDMIQGQEEENSNISRSNNSSYFNISEETISPESPPPYVSANLIKTKIIAFDRVGENQYNNSNNYESIYKELFSVCQRN